MREPKRLLYQPNRLGYSLMLLFIVSAGVYLVFTLKSMAVNQAIAFVSLVNIVAILFAFLVAVKTQGILLAHPSVFRRFSSRAMIIRLSSS
ncbi:MAG: hypothetical protein MZU97_26235 [Bacillus subtilis]|nr:hypothetical protein [Bacillus subtilis]